MKVLTPFVLVVSLMFANIANANVILSLETAQEYDLPGNVVSVTLMIDELGDYVPLSLSSFDIDITFDSTVFSFAGYSLFNELGNLDAAEALDFSWEEYLPGTINVSELSLLSNNELWDFQPASFSLAKLLFNVNPGVGNRTTDFTYAFADLVDVNGDVVNIIEVNNASVTVPAPSSILLIVIGLLATFPRKPRNLCTLANPINS